MTTRRNPAFPWWYWIWLVHILFVGAMYMYMFTPYKPDWFKLIFSAISLGSEQNYAVWWSGICLFIGSHLFYRAASANPEPGESWKWSILSLGLLALAFDEIGSLHEMVSKIAGWKGLIPFAIVFIGGFGAALLAMFRQPGYRIAGALILMGVLLFASVASLEFVEHNIEMNKRQQKSRLIIEEGIELFAMSLIIIAGLLSLKQLGVADRRLSAVIGNIGELFLHPVVVFLLFSIQFIAVAAFAIPHAGRFSEGDPSVVFPIIMYFSLSMMCIRLGLTRRRVLLWWSFALLFLFTSLCQIHSFTILLNRLMLDVNWFKFPPDTWYITIVPLLWLCVVFLLNGWISFRQMLPDLFLFICIVAILYPDNHSPMIYSLFSGCTAFLCYRLISTLQNPKAPT